MISKKILLKGMSIEVLESNGDSEPVFLFHGNSGAANSFGKLLSGALGKRYKLISVSFPYHGNSSPMPLSEGILSIAMLGDFASDIINYYDSRRYVLVGQSLGGHALLERLSKFPGVAGLMLVSAPPISKSTLQAAFKPDPSEGALFKCDLKAKEISRLTRCFVHKDDKGTLDLIKDNIKKTQFGFRAALGKSITAGLIEDEFESLLHSKIPVAFLAGAHDKFINRSYYDLIPADRIWSTSVRYFEDSGHVLHLDNPEHFEKNLGEFIKHLNF